MIRSQYKSNVTSCESSVTVPVASPTCRFTRLTPKVGKIRLARGAVCSLQDQMEDLEDPKVHQTMTAAYASSGFEFVFDTVPKSRPERTVLVTSSLPFGDTVDLRYADDFRSELLRPSRPDHMAIERLANDYGFSSTRLQNYRLSDGSQAMGEPIDSWIELIFMHRIVAAMLVVRDHEDPAILRREFDEATAWDRTARTGAPWDRDLFFGREEAAGELTWHHLLRNAYMMIKELKGDPVFDDSWYQRPGPDDDQRSGLLPNRHPVEVLINMALSPTQLAVDGWGSDATLGISILGARPASWASLVYSLASGRVPSTCEQCGRLMSPHAASKPGYRRFCGDSCRVRQSRIKKRAESLKAKGRSRPRIAKELGLDLELVRKWFP